MKPRFYLLRVTHNDILDLLEAVRTQAFYESERAKRLRSLEVLLERKHEAISEGRLRNPMRPFPGDEEAAA